MMIQSRVAVARILTQDLSSAPQRFMVAFVSLPDHHFATGRFDINTRDRFLAGGMSKPPGLCRAIQEPPPPQLVSSCKS